MKRSLLFAALVSTSAGAFAQQRPDAGQQMLQIPQPLALQLQAVDLDVRQPTAAAPAGDGGARVQVDALRVTGQTRFTEQELIAATASGRAAPSTSPSCAPSPRRSRNSTIAAAISSPRPICRRRTSATASVTIAVIEGRYGKIELHNQSQRFPDGAARRRAGRAWTRRHRRHRAARAALAAAVGHSRRRGQFDADARAARSAPPTSSSTSSPAAASPAASRPTMPATATPAPTAPAARSISTTRPAIGDLLSLRVLTSRRGSPMAAPPTRRRSAISTVGVAFRTSTYALGREFKALDADGTADIASLYRQLSAGPLAQHQSLRLGRGRCQMLQGPDRRGLDRHEAPGKVLDLGLSGDHRDFSAAAAGPSIRSAGRSATRHPQRRRPRDRSRRRRARNGGYGKLAFERRPAADS